MLYNIVAASNDWNLYGMQMQFWLLSACIYAREDVIDGWQDDPGAPSLVYQYVATLRARLVGGLEVRKTEIHPEL